MLQITFGLVMASLGGEAHAAYPDDVSLRSMSTFNGDAMDVELITAAWTQLVRELGAASANKPVADASTLGVNGFEVGFDSSFSFISSSTEGGVPSPWELAHEDEAPSPVLWTPRFSVRKGLPLSLEVGATAGYVAFSNQSLFGGYGRWGIWEGYRKFPDVVLQIGYMGYIGNDELELGVMDVSTTVGYTLPFGTIAGINETKFSPFIGLGRLRIHAAPRLGEEEQLALGVTELSGWSKSDFFTAEMRPWQLHGGFRLLKGAFQFRGAAAFAFGVIPTVDVGMGFVY